MSNDDDELVPVRPASRHLARAQMRVTWGKASLEADARITPTGLLAIGGMVGIILLAVAPIVRAAGQAKRES
jgi:hypothetical protein